jgi:hypothetical protein
LGTFIGSLTNATGFDTHGLEVRARYTKAVIAMNAVYAAAATDRDSLKQGVTSALNELSTMSLGTKPGRGLKELKARATEDASGMRYLVCKDTVEPTPQSVTGMYNLACTFGSRNDVTWPGAAHENFDQDDPKAVRLLKLAAADAENATWLKKDPQLAEFRKRAAYRRTLLEERRGDFFDIAPVKAFATPLRNAGYGTAALIASEAPDQLAPRIYASVPMSAQIVQVAVLRESLAAFRPTKELDTWAVEILDELVSRGLANRRALRALSESDRATILHDVVTAVTQRCQLDDDADPARYDAELERWLVWWSRRL